MNLKSKDKAPSFNLPDQDGKKRAPMNSFKEANLYMPV